MAPERLAATVRPVDPDGFGQLMGVALEEAAAADPKAGACGSLYNLGADPRLNHDMTTVPGVRADEAAALIRRFFAERRSPTGR